MPVNGQTIKIPIEAEITNVSKTISELRELTKNIRPDTKGFKDINTLLDQAERKLLDVQKRSANGLIDKRALTGIERSFGEAFASVETAANKLQRIDFSGLVLSDAQKDSLNSIAIAIEKARTEYSKIETSKLDELAKSGKNVVESLNLAKIDLNTDGIDSSIDKIDNKIEELNKSLNTLQNRKNEKVRLIEIEQSELDKLNKIKQIFTAKEGSERAAFSDIFTASGDKFRTGGKEALHGMLTALGLDNISLETLKNTSATKIQELWDSIEKKVEEVRKEHESRRKRLSNSAKTDEQNIGLKTQDIVSLTELRGNIEALKVDPDVKEEFSQLTNEIQRLTLENEKLKQEIIEQAGLQNGAAKAIKDTGVAADGAARKIEETSNALDRMNKITNTIGNIKSTIAQWMGFYQVINLSRRAIQSMVQDIRELDKVMTEIAIVTNMTQQDLWNQMNTYQSIANEYAVSTKGVYEVSQLFYQQGLDSVSVMKLTTETLKMAKIANLDYSTATDYMTVALRGFHLEMDQAQNVVDVYSNIASKSASSTKELANAMSKTASSAAAVGSSFENTTAMIALMVETTRESSQNIGSALKSIISRYGEMKTSPAKLVDSEGEELDFNKVDTALKSVGISLKNAQGQFRDFDEVILELSKKWQTLDVNTQRYIATIMAGNRQQSRFLALVGDYSRLAELTEAAANSQDVATLQTLKTLDSLESKIQNVKTAWQGFYANLGLETVFKSALEIITNILNRLNQMPKLFGKLPISAASIAAQMISMIKNFSTYVITKLAETWTRVANDYKKKMAQAGQEGGKALADNTDRETKKLSQKWNDFKNNKKRVAGAAGTALSTVGMAGTAYAMSIGDDNAGLRVGVQAASGAATLAGSALSGFATGGPWGAVLGGVTGLIAALPNLINAINDLKNKENLAAAAAKEHAEKMSQNALVAKNETKDLENNINKLEELTKKRYESNESYEEWLNYKTQIAEAYPQLVSFYTSEGEAVIDLAGAYDVLANSRVNSTRKALEAAQAELKARQLMYNLTQHNLESRNLGTTTFGDGKRKNSLNDYAASLFMEDVGVYSLKFSSSSSSKRYNLQDKNFNRLFNTELQDTTDYNPYTGISNKRKTIANFSPNANIENIKYARSLRTEDKELKQIYAQALYETMKQNGVFNNPWLKDLIGYSEKEFTAMQNSIENSSEPLEEKQEELANLYLQIAESLYGSAEQIAENEQELAKINEELAKARITISEAIARKNSNNNNPLTLDQKKQYSVIGSDNLMNSIFNELLNERKRNTSYGTLEDWSKNNETEFNKNADEVLEQLYSFYNEMGEEAYKSLISTISDSQNFTTFKEYEKAIRGIEIDRDEEINNIILESAKKNWTEKNEKMQSAFKEAIESSFGDSNTDVDVSARLLRGIADDDESMSVLGEISARYLDSIQNQWYNLVTKANSQYDKSINATFLADIYGQTSRLNEAVNNTVAGILSTADLSSKEGIQAAIDSIETYQSTITDETQKVALDNILSNLKTHKDQLLININTELAAYSKSIDEALEANEKIHKTQSSGFDKISDMETALKKINANRKDDNKLTFNQAFVWDKNLNSYTYSAEGLQAALAAQNAEAQTLYEEIKKSIDQVSKGLLSNVVKSLDSEAAGESASNIINEAIIEAEQEREGANEIKQQTLDARIAVLRAIANLVGGDSSLSIGKALTQIEEQNKLDRQNAEELNKAADNFTKIAELSRASKAFDYSSYLSSGRTATDKEKLQTAYNEYNNARIAMGKETLGSLDSIIEVLDAGGTAAINLAQQIAEDRGISLQPNDVENLYSAEVTNYKNALKILKEGIQVNSIVADERIRSILNNIDGFEFDSNGVVISVGNMVDAFIAIYNAMKESGEATAEDLNESYLEIIQTNNQKDVAANSIISSASSFNSSTIKDFVEAIGGAYSLDKILDTNGNVINGWAESIERIGIDSYRISDWDIYKKQVETAIGHTLDETTDEYINAYVSWLDTNASVDPTTVMTQLLPNLQKLSYAQIGLIARVFDIEGGVNAVIEMVESNGDGTFNGGALLEQLKDKYKSDDEAFQRALINQRVTVASSMTSAIISYVEAGAERNAWDEATFNYAYSDYEKALKALGESAPIILETLKQELAKGGEAAVAAAEVFLSEGQKLSPQEIESLYRANVKRWVDAIDTVTAQPGAIIDQTTATIINNTGGLATEIGDSGQYVVTTATNLYEAYNYILNELVINGSKNISDLNKVAAKALENRDGEQVVIDALGDAASMTYTRLGEILEQKGIRLTEQYFDNNLNGIIESIGGGKVRIKDFNSFATDIMGWEANSEEYWSAFKTYNDAMADLNRKAERNIKEELQNAINAQEGDWINLTQLTSKIPEELLNQIISGTGAVIENGILKLDEGATANIAEIVSRILDITSSSGLLLDNEVNELKDAIQNLLETYINLFKNGISGSLSSTDAGKLQSWASTLNPGLNLDFTKTAEGLKLSNQSAIDLYQSLKSIDALRANLIFNDLAENLQKSDDRFSSISHTMGTIANLENQIKSARGSNTVELEKQLSLAQEIARAQAIDPSSYDFMSRSLPDAFKGPQNYWNSIGEMFNTINTSAKDGYMGIQDFYNIVNEMNNLAALGGEFEFMGYTLDGNLENAASLIEAGFGALSNIDGEGVKIDLSKFGVDFASGADQMNANVQEGIKAMAQSQIDMLDALIQMLEAIVAFEELGKIDVNNDGLFDWKDMFESEDSTEYLEAYDKQRQKIMDMSKKNPDFQAALDSFKINLGEENFVTLRDILTKSAQELEQAGFSIEQQMELIPKIIGIISNLNLKGDLSDVQTLAAAFAELGTEMSVVTDKANITLYGGYNLQQKNGKYIVDGKEFTNAQQAVEYCTIKDIEDVKNVEINKEGKAVGTMNLNGTVIKVTTGKEGITYTLDDGSGRTATSRQGLYELLFVSATDKQDGETVSQWTARVGISKVEITPSSYQNIQESIRAELEKALATGDTAQVQEVVLKYKAELGSLQGLSNKEIEERIGLQTATININAEEANKTLDDTGKKADEFIEGINSANPKLNVDARNAVSALSLVTTSAQKAKAAILSASNQRVTVNVNDAVNAAYRVQTAWQNAANAITRASNVLANSGNSSPQPSVITGSGSTRATGNVALAKGRQTLLGELGPELYVTGGHYYIAGQNGAEFVNLPDDAIVFNHLQTERLLKNGSTGRGKAIGGEKRAVAHAKGNAEGPAMASASAALAALKQIRAMWDSMLKASLSDLGSKAGLGKKGGGGGNDDKGQTVKLDSGYIRDLERWYNLLRQIDRLEQDINYEEKLRAKLQADTVANGELIYDSQRRTYEMLQREIDDRVELAGLKKGYYEQRMREIEQGPWGQLFYFNEEGVPQMKNLQFLADVFASSEEGGAVHSAREQYAMLQQAGFGSLLQYKEDGSIIEWFDDEGKPREDAYKEAVEAFSAKLDSQTDEINSLREDYIEEMGNILDLQAQQNEILTQIRENTIAVEQEVLKAIEDSREREIDELQKQRDALSDSTDKFIDGLTESLNKEREMYNSQESDNELLQMRRQLAILQRSGGPGSQIRSLQDQIRQREQEAYFEEQENQINAIKQASDLQLERLDAQISLMQETLEFQKAQGLLWDQVHQIMQGTHEEITQFVTGNNSEWWAKSATQSQNDLVALDNKIGQWVAHRDDVTTLGETIKNAINNGIAAITTVVATVSSSETYTVSGTGSYVLPSSSSSGGGSSGGGGGAGRTSNTTAAKKSTKKVASTTAKAAKTLVSTTYEKKDQSYHNIIYHYSDGSTQKSQQAHNYTPAGSNNTLICTQCGQAKNTGSTASIKNKTNKNTTKSGGCFVAGSKVIMANGIKKNIEEIKIGEKVIAYNDKENKFEPKKVVKAYAHYNTPRVLKITLSNGVVLGITPGHPILTTEGWKSRDIENSLYEHGVQAEWLNIGDEVLGYTGNALVTSIEEKNIPSNYVTYNIEVETCHTYLVDGLVVHNAKVVAPAFAGGGIIDYTGPAWVDGSKKKPEGILNAEQLDMLRNSVLTRKNPIAALLADYGGIVSNTANASTYNTINRGESMQIGNIELNMNVSKIANDYDARRAGEKALEQIMVKIAQKNGVNNIKRR